MAFAALHCIQVHSDYYQIAKRSKCCFQGFPNVKEAAILRMPVHQLLSELQQRGLSTEGLQQLMETAILLIAASL
jgi:hypothetical protein